MSGGHDDDELHEEHEEHGNHEAWVIPYADLLTLLMAMFIALFAISSVNVDKAKRLAMGFNNAGSHPVVGLFSDSGGKSAVQGVGDNQTGGKGVLGGGTSANPGSSGTQQSRTTPAITASSAIQAAEKKEQKSFAHDQQQLQQAANENGVGNTISFQLEGRGLVVRLANDNVLFTSGQAVIEPQGAHVLQVIGAVLAHINNPLLIEGYTDNRPINTSQYASNWELSTARADVVLRYLVDGVGLDESRMTAQGYGEHDPVASNATPEGQARNRRVEIVIESQVINEILQANGLTSQAVSPSGSAAPSPAKGATTPTTKPDLGNVVGNLGAGN
ncbi:MAG TPA: OmpA family protein [Acidimicrobiia bacterium]|jgi:chemotaxis protein MotB